MYEPLGPSADIQHEDPAPDATRNNCRKTIQEMLDQPGSSTAAQVIHYFIIFIIIASTAAVVVETMPEFHRNPYNFPIEMCITGFFTLEFTLRLYACDSIQAFATNGYNIVDFLAIFPGYVEIAMLLASSSYGDMHQSLDDRAEHGTDKPMRTLRMARIMRLVRVFRVMRLAKVARHSTLLSIVLSACVKVSQSGLVVVLMFMGFAMVLSASLMYVSEAGLCEDSGLHCTGPSAFSSIPASFWWAVATLTTVGYGDMVPHTATGKFIGAATAGVGVIVVAVGVALVSTNFRETLIEEKAKAKRHPRLHLPRGSKAAPSQQQQVQEFEELLNEFNTHSSLLISKLKSLGVSQESSVQHAMITDMLSSHMDRVASDAKSMMHCILGQPSAVPKPTR